MLMWDNKMIHEKYDEIRKTSRDSYILVNMKIKRLRIINFLNNKEYGKNIITAFYETVKNFLGTDEYIGQATFCSFNVLMKVSKDINDIDLLRRFNSLDEQIEQAGNGKYHGVIFCGIGICFLSEYDVDFDTAEYYAEVSRSQSLESPHMCSHLNIYGHDFIDQNLIFANFRQDFNQAMKNGDITVFLQPKVNLKTGEILFAEALIRWIDKEKGMIPLGDFLPALEENGIINLIDKLAFEKACEYTEKWYKLYHKKIKISVNISKTSFNYWLFFEEYKEIYEKYHPPKECLEVELLESIVLNQTDRVREVVDEIQAFGISCSLDDFGSGYSSYSVLASSNLNVLKIDRSLFQNYNNEKERTIVRHIVEMAHEFGMEVVAEGVENPDYVTYLKEHHCEYIQGFIYYKPMPLEEFEERFVKGNEKIHF